MNNRIIIIEIHYTTNNTFRISRSIIIRFPYQNLIITIERESPGMRRCTSLYQTINIFRRVRPIYTTIQRSPPSIESSRLPILRNPTLIRQKTKKEANDQSPNHSLFQLNTNRSNIIIIPDRKRFLHKNILHQHCVYCKKVASTLLLVQYQQAIGARPRPFGNFVG